MRMKLRLPIIACLVLLCSCQESTSGTDLSLEPKEYMEGWTRDEYAMKYHEALTRAQGGDPSWQFQVSIMADPNLGALPKEEMCKHFFRDNLFWLKKSAFSGWSQALKKMSDGFAEGNSGYEKDTELSNCFKEALTNKAVLPKCIQLESNKTYPGLHWKKRENSSRWSCLP